MLEEGTVNRARVCLLCLCLSVDYLIAGFSRSAKCSYRAEIRDFRLIIIFVFRARTGTTPLHAREFAKDTLRFEIRVLAFPNCVRAYHVHKLKVHKLKTGELP